MHFGDVRDIVANLLTLAFFVTPVLYPVEAVPERWRWLLRANPVRELLRGRPRHALLLSARCRRSDWALDGRHGRRSRSRAGGAVFERLRDSLAEEA